MPNAAPWLSLADVATATAWWEHQRQQGVSELNVQAVLALVGHTVRQSHRYVEQHWHPDDAGAAQPLADLRSVAASAFHAALAWSVEHRRRQPCQSGPAPSPAVMAATWVVQAHERLKQQNADSEDAISAWLRLEAAQAAALAVAFHPRHDRASPELVEAMFDLVVSLAGVCWAAERAAPWFQR